VTTKSVLEKGEAKLKSASCDFLHENITFIRTKSPLNIKIDRAVFWQ
jgi:hypothetical protein